MKFPWRKANPAIGQALNEERLDMLIDNLENRPRRQAFAERVNYGYSSTVHQTGTINIQVDGKTGEIVSVWYRCLNLPFRVSKALPDSLAFNPRDMFIEEITYQRREESSQ